MDLKVHQFACLKCHFLRGFAIGKVLWIVAVLLAIHSDSKGEDVDGALVASHPEPRGQGVIQGIKGDGLDVSSVSTAPQLMQFPARVNVMHSN